MRVTLILLALAGLSACDRQVQNEPAGEPAMPAALTYEGGDYETDADKVAHGKRLADILDCTGCHGANLQGNNLADSPSDGAMYAPNITLVLAKYNEADFDRLIRHGEPKDGREFWFMPVESYQFLSDADLAALLSYVRTFKPAGKPLPAFEKSKGLQRDIAAGQIGNAKFQIAKYRADQPVEMGKTYSWGRYLAQTTCTACHNNALQGWEGFTPDLDIAGAYSNGELTRLLTTGEGKSKKDLGMMSAVARAHFSKLTPRERAAVVGYVKVRADRPQPAQAH